MNVESCIKSLNRPSYPAWRQVGAAILCGPAPTMGGVRREPDVWELQLGGEFL